MSFEGFPRTLIATGLPPNHPRAEWLKYSGLFATSEQPLPAETFTDQLPKMCFDRFQRVVPLQQWLVDLRVD